jgi:hypothetical protein
MTTAERILGKTTAGTVTAVVGRPGAGFVPDSDDADQD